MADRYCRHCGLEFAGEQSVCPRCAAPRDAETAGLFDAATGAPLNGELPPLRCWHCGQPIGQQQLICSNCSIPLTQRSAGAVAYDVVPRSVAPPPQHRPPAVPDVRTVEPTPEAEAVLTSAADGQSPHSLENGAKREAPPTQEVSGNPEQRRRNYFVRHWRGALSLPVAFWVNVILLNFVLGIVTLIVVLNWGPIYNPYLALAVLVGFLGVAIAIEVWEIVGTWRSAQARYRDQSASGWRRFWAGAAQFWTVLLGLRAVGSVVGFWPALSEFFEMGFQGDPSIPDFEVVTLPDGSGVVVQGGFKFGLAGALRAALDRAPDASVVYLNSDGGRLAAAAQTYDLIRDRGLNTYVVGLCQSACTLAFVAGADRTTGALGALGFHQAYLEGGSQQDLDFWLDDFIDRYREAGVSQQLLDRTRTVAPTSMWYPTPSQLYEAGVITRPRDESIRPAAIPFAIFGPMVSDLLNVGLPEDLAPGWRLVEVSFDADSVTYETEIDLNIISEERITSAIADPASFCSAGTVPMLRDDASEVWIFRSVAGDLLGQITLTSDQCRDAGAAL